ncbi:hypothetical protein [Leuconostoc gasicomitatum]|jgi:hypothetical protein|uniref:hypothetical protein n=1 Tax=Leuconostoc gasicomitatum TaxID=115778 RepID=UPI000744C4E7|nr:hypothetical protein [Leuconostoc gasicomitatum]MBZ5972429.1 hypothetical protein [Leuconostoc gasicomitatum]CUR64599.1 Uncharacterized protein LEKG_2012 [Leuconostoc gasicomitatum KG16-1]
MSLSNLEKQQEKLNKLNEKIKSEKEKIDKKLGHEIIKLSNFDYSEFDQDKIKDIAKQVAHIFNPEYTSQNQDSTKKENNIKSSDIVNSNDNHIS